MKQILTIGDWWPVTHTEEVFNMNVKNGIAVETSDGNYLAMREAEVERLRTEVIRLTNENSMLKLRVEALEFPTRKR